MKGAWFTLTEFAEPWTRWGLSLDIEDDHLVLQTLKDSLCRLMTWKIEKTPESWI